MMRRFFSTVRPQATVFKSDAHAQSATTLARLEKEKMRQSLLQGSGSNLGSSRAPSVTEVEQARRAVIMNRKTGLPLYEPQTVKSSAHVFKEYKKQGIPMPASTGAAQNNSSQSNYYLPTAIVLAIGAAISYTLTSQASTYTDSFLQAVPQALIVGEESVSSPTPVARLSSETRSNASGNDKQNIAVMDFEAEVERLTIEQQPLWLQRQR